MIVDSSIWVEFFARTPTAAGRVLRRFLESGGQVYLTAAIFQEVLQGARDEPQVAALNRELANFPLCEPADARETARKAAEMYARCRWRGVTIRSSNDCLIAAIAIEHGQPLMTLDRDFTHLRDADSSLQLVALPTTV